jgi:hypothetical protein
MFLHSRKFAKAANLLSRTLDTDFIQAQAVSWAFALEVLLKCLLALENKQLPQHHELDTLYRQLDRRHKQMINQLFNEFTKDDKQFQYAVSESCEHVILVEDILAMNRDAFKRFRYSYEAKPCSFYGVSFCYRAVIQVIVGDKPAWRV